MKRNMPQSVKWNGKIIKNTNNIQLVFQALCFGTNRYVRSHLKSFSNNIRYYSVATCTTTYERKKKILREIIMKIKVSFRVYGYQRQQCTTRSVFIFNFAINIHDAKNRKLSRFFSAHRQRVAYPLYLFLSLYLSLFYFLSLFHAFSSNQIIRIEFGGELAPIRL